MAWKQLRSANWKVGYLGGWCEGYVSMAWGFSKFIYNSKGHVIGTQGNGQGKVNYPSATAHWRANLGNHPNVEPPLGITVPVFFSLGNVPEGHVAIRLADGTVASSTQAGYHPQGFIHPNLKHLIDTYAPGNGGCKYLGWSEYVAGVRVVENTAQGGGEDMTIIVKPIEPIRFQLHRGVQVWDIAAQKVISGTGTDFRVTQKTNIVNVSGRSSTFYIFEDRAKKGEVVGAREEDLYAKDNTRVAPQVIKSTDWKAEYDVFKSRVEKEMSQLSKDIISFKVEMESAQAAQKRAEAALKAANATNSEIRASIETRAQELASEALAAQAEQAFKVAYLTQTGQHPPAKTIEEWKRTDMTADAWVRANVRNDVVYELQTQLAQSNASLRKLADEADTHNQSIKDLSARIDEISRQISQEKQARAAAEKALRDERIVSESLRNELSVANQKSSPVAHWSLVELVGEVIHRVVKLRFSKTK